MFYLVLLQFFFNIGVQAVFGFEIIYFFETVINIPPFA